MDQLILMGFCFGLGVCIGNNKTRHKLQDIISHLQTKAIASQQKQSETIVKETKND